MNILHLISRAFRFALVLLLAASAAAEYLEAQRKVFQAHMEDTEYRFTLGTLKTVNANTVAEREIVLNGDVDRITYEFKPIVSLGEAWQMLEARYSPHVSRELFACSGLACGSSNAWANDRFQIKELYGLDQTQKYRAFALRDVPNKFVALYFVQRGNHRIYAQVDTITAQTPSISIAPSASAIDDALSQRGYYKVHLEANGDAAVFDDDELAAIVTALRKKPFARYYIVGHAYREASLDANLARGTHYAEQLVDALKQKGVKTERLEVKSVGSLAPDQPIPQERVVILVRS